MPKPQLPQPIAESEPVREVAGTLERILADVPPSTAQAVDNPDAAAEAIAREAARRAAILSGSLALPPGPLGMLTVLPDLFLIWKVQRQMIADIFALHGRSAELTRSHMLYCLFRHFASQVVRDVVVRAGQRVAVQQLSSGALRNLLTSLGVKITRRIAGSTASRWIPVAGAAAVGAYAYWDTLQVAKTARRLIAESAADPVAGDAVDRD